MNKRLCALRIMASFGRPRRNKRGNVVVFVALSAMTIIFFAALAIDQGFLTMEKDGLQNNVEAAVDSGVRILHKDSSPNYPATLSLVHSSLQANGETVSEQDLQDNYYFPGFYDYKDVYSDFLTHKNFASAWLGDEIPEGESLNAVAVIDLKKDVDTIEIKPSGQSKGRVGASAVAYGKSYTFLALDDDPEALVFGVSDSEPSFDITYQNCLIGSNGGITFFGGESFDRTGIEAVGAVSSIKGTPPEYKEMEKMTVPSIDWDRLRQDAEANGKVYDPETWTDEWQQDEYGNWYCRLDRSVANQEIAYVFLPQGEDINGVYSTVGDHQGRTYYFDTPDPADVGTERVVLYFLNTDTAYDTYDLGPAFRRIWNCTIAAPCEMSTYPINSKANNHPIYYGNYETYGNNGLVYLYSEEFGSDTTHCWMVNAGQGYARMAIPTGVVVRTNGKFKMRDHLPTSPATYYLKVVADTIEIANPWSDTHTINYVGGFGPPEIYRQGLLN